MSIIIPIKDIKVSDFNDFCYDFKIISDKIAGDNGTDEELIIEELDKITNQKWLVNFVDDNRDGYFRLQLFE